MKKSTIIVATIAALTVLACTLALVSRPKEPRYMGKTLREWIEGAQPVTYTNKYGLVMQDWSLNSQAALQGALRMHGTNAALILVRILDKSDSLLTGAKMTAARTSLLPASVKTGMIGDLSATHRRLSLISEAMRFLQDDALHAIPRLEHIICEPDRGMSPVQAISILADIGHRAVPALQRCLTNAPSDRQRLIQATITRIYERDLNAANSETRKIAAFILADMPQPPSHIIPVLVDLLDSPHVETRLRAINGLARHLPTLAPSLVVAYRAVEKQATADDSEIRRVATDLLAKLNPPPPEKKP